MSSQSSTLVTIDSIVSDIPKPYQNLHRVPGEPTVPVDRFSPSPCSGACSCHQPLSAAVWPHCRPTPATIWKQCRCLLVHRGHARPTRVPPRPRELPAARSVLDLGAPARDDVSLFFFLF
jgi:hypothetical protein